MTLSNPDRASWFSGNDARCNPLPSAPTTPRRLVLLGAPGVGKGTQAQLLSAHLGACHLSTGDVFRAARAGGHCQPSSAMGRALDAMQRGELVTDAIVLSIVRERVGCLRCGGGFLLDGFPRTVTQASALQQLLAHHNLRLDAVIDYRLPHDEIIQRLSGRRTCPNCKSVFHVNISPPALSDTCDHCGAALIQREDDRPGSIVVRIDAYERSTAPLTDLYEREGILIRIDATGSPTNVLTRTLGALKHRLG